VAEFIGAPKINVFDAVFAKDSSTTRISGFGDLSLASFGVIEKQAKSGIALGIRAENLGITMDYETDSLKGVLDLVERLDNLIVAYVRSFSDQVSQVGTIKIVGDIEISTGDRVGLRPLGLVVVFDRDGRRIDM